MSTTKADIINSAYDKLTGFSKKDTVELVDAVFGVMKEALEQGESIKVSGFGKFNVREKNERLGRNPKTGEELTISARRVVTFKPSTILRESLNEGGE